MKTASIVTLTDEVVKCFNDRVHLCEKFRIVSLRINFHHSPRQQIRLAWGTTADAAAIDIVCDVT